MNFKTPFKVLTTAALIGTLSLSAVAPGMAHAEEAQTTATADDQQNFKLKNIIMAKDGVNYSFSLQDYIVNYEELIAAGYSLEYLTAENGQVFSKTDYAVGYDKGDQVADVLARLTPQTSEQVGEVKEAKVEDGKVVVEETTPGEEATTVETVTAITQTVEKGQAAELKFQINGTEYTKTTFDKKFKEAGYTVSFLTDDKTNAAITADGKVTVTADVKSFNYAVQVKDKAGKAINEPLAADFAKVTVATNDVTEVSAAALSNELSYVTLSNATDVDFVATAGTTGLSKEATKAQLGSLKVESAISSDKTVATYEGNKINAKKEGTTTFTVKFKGIEGTVEVPVEVKAQAVATSLKAEDVKVPTSTTLASLLADVKVLDQYDQNIAKTGVTFTVYKGTEEQTDLNTFSDAGTYTVKATTGADATLKELGSFKVEVVDIASKNPDKYTLTFVKGSDNTNKDTIDLNPADTNEATQAEIKVAGTYENVAVAKENFDPTLDVETNNEGVTAEFAKAEELEDKSKIIVTIDDATKVKAGDTVKVSIFTKKGDAKTVQGTVEVKIANTTPQITTLTLKSEEATVLTAGSTLEIEADADHVSAITTEEAAKQLVAKDADAKELKDFSEDQIASVEFENRVVNTKDKKVTGDVTVTLAPEYGGKVFEFKGEVKFAKTNDEVALEEATSTLLTKINTGTVVVADYTNAQVTGVTATNVFVINKLAKATSDLDLDKIKAIVSKVTTAESKAINGVEVTEADTEDYSVASPASPAEGYTAYKFEGLNVGKDLEKVYTTLVRADNGNIIDADVAAGGDYTELPTGENKNLPREAFYQFNNATASGDYIFYGVKADGSIVVFKILGHTKVAEA